MTKTPEICPDPVVCKQQKCRRLCRRQVSEFCPYILLHALNYGESGLPPWNRPRKFGKSTKVIEMAARFVENRIPVRILAATQGVAKELQRFLSRNQLCCTFSHHIELITLSSAIWKPQGFKDIFLTDELSPGDISRYIKESPQAIYAGGYYTRERSVWAEEL